MARTIFAHDATPSSVELRLTRHPVFGAVSEVPVAEWSSATSSTARLGVAHVLSALDFDDASVHQVQETLHLKHQFVSGLSEPQAAALGFPASVPFVLDVRAQGRFTSPEFGIAAEWLAEGNRPLRAERTGCFLAVGDDRYRIPARLLNILLAIDAYRANKSGAEAARIELLAALQDQLPREGTNEIAIDQYLQGFRVVHAAAFSLTLNTGGSEFLCDPMLFGRNVRRRASAGGAVNEVESLLTPHQQERFARERFQAFDDARSSYTIERGLYVHVDPALQKALGVVRQVQRGSPETRRHFARYPQAFLKQALSEDLPDDLVEQLFVETEQYSERVVDIGLWQPPVFPWITPNPNHWLPEKFGILVRDTYIQLSTDDVPELRQLLASAMDANVEAVTFQGHTIPATPGTLDALSSLAGAIAPLAQTSDRPPADVTSATSREKHVLIVGENFETTAYTRQQKPRSQDTDRHIPSIVRPALKPHQQAGLAWLQDAWARGSNGVLLADDMGLGKTLQALAFMAWLKGLPAAVRGSQNTAGPILVVAPTGLLANWSQEHDLHLSAPGLGELCRAYGRHLTLLKASDGRDVDLGVPMIERRRLQRADWILTTYETLRDYHVSFAGIRFACVVFDEMQKVKNPSSLATHAAKSVNADFILGLTGTPIENRTEDLWSIMDIVDPGRLGDLKTFSSRYAAAEVSALEDLRDSLLAPTASGPAAVLRRMKSNELEGLPKKIHHARHRHMPPEQARAYADVVALGQTDERPPMLELLHRLRGVSLHPISPLNSWTGESDQYIAGSARLSELFKILDVIAEKREKALVFLESLDLQDYLALMIKDRFKMRERPLLINGQVTGDVRQKRVRAFQERRGVFDVMILSPRAGGVGITLTAANHVIHLSRWWNPAVEDQCTDRVYRIGQEREVHVYFPMAIHPNYGHASFDVLLDKLLDRKRELSRRMLAPPVSVKSDQDWFTQQLHTKANRRSGAPLDITEIDAMEPQEFERWVLRRLGERGWEVDRTPTTHDGGADGVTLHRASNMRIIVQCKHRQSGDAVCADAVVEELLKARQRYGIDARLLGVTNAKAFSKSVAAAAQLHGVNLIARSDLSDWPDSAQLFPA